MTRPATSGFQKPIDPGTRRKVGLAVISYGEVEGRQFAECSCGQPFVQAREKVREDAIDRHLSKKHNGRGIRV